MPATNHKSKSKAVVGSVRRRLQFDWSASRAELLVLMLSLLAAIAVVPHVMHFSHRNDLERNISVFPLLKPLESISRQLQSWEFYLYDARFTARGPVVPDAREKIAIVGIDDNSIAVLGQWPWPRRWHAQLIQRLKAAGASVIAFDIDFSSRQSPRDDALLASAMSNAGNVILASNLATDIALRQNGARLVQYRAVTPLEQLDEQTPDLAMVWVPRDSDGRVRRYPMRFVINDVQLGSLAELSVAAQQKLLDGVNNGAYEMALKEGLWPTSDSRPYEIPWSLSKPPYPDAPRVWTTPLHFYGPKETFPTYSYVSVLQPDQFSDEALREKFAGRIVFVGATASILKDTFIAPTFSTSIETETDNQANGEDASSIVNTDLSLGTTSSEISGVELHATAAAMLMNARYIHSAPPWVTYALLFGLTLAAGAWNIALRRPINYLSRITQLFLTRRNIPLRTHSIVWFACYALLGPLPILLFWEAVKWAFTSYNLWIVAVYPITGAVLGSLSVLLLLFTLETAERRKTVTQMGRFMSAGVLQEVLAAPEEGWPLPRRTPATVIFTDLQGFTPYSESHEAEQVVAALNAYMTRMVPIIERHGGTIDKYIGDAIMAFFGAPKPRADHAEQALRCAVELQEENARFRAETGIPFYTRIGIHTGDVIAGCMGSEGEGSHEARINYTVIGDTVNLAARLESKNKDLGSWILCSSATYDAAPGLVEGQSTRVEVKGKSEVIDAYQVLGFAGQKDAVNRWKPNEN